MTGYVDVCALSEIPNGKHRAYTLSGTAILVCRSGNDVFAIENRCSHLNFPLKGGRQIGCEIICPHHGARFDFRTGKAVGGPAVDPIQHFEVRIHNDRVEIRPRIKDKFWLGSVQQKDV